MSMTRAGQDQRSPGLAGIQRSVLTQVAAAVGPVVPGGVYDDQIG
ncbi:hypothetical protein ThrDRAFT_03548 [Frankia casuarinae]|nr:hypothetical protein [Frankia casuarinae]ETA01290.1 hypothetical protein CcI6DRAFT_03289 [Frankia sp. CcI6]KDA42034.1 hypothetical protein BMG523Draft_03149 [Frankia sp. BMG5.23]KEZ36317.1 hypothetical protein CEDDRAFT_02339 [Frankia sp. CeD]EYT90836.1 hypothetical protein ThrDRAFT_03548 [Frankia casuarinae]OAA22797.1 hypothetical protein AAY23_106028 [Frankia casuarinae]